MKITKENLAKIAMEELKAVVEARLPQSGYSDPLGSELDKLIPMLQKMGIKGKDIPLKLRDLADHYESGEYQVIGTGSPLLPGMEDYAPSPEEHIRKMQRYLQSLKEGLK